ncbi:hypothetical protein [Leptospira brenneri]|uniref:hypothetical protein n=1 Tax=Leptospira brenneri TaxID=2023182 RepID=UPI000C2B0294|nr:hypothetical protein [Leptospira brenneri]PJZ44973.1 hypothetical protein CH361_12030 [Leptospira brenneri]
MINIEKDEPKKKENETPKSCKKCGASNVQLYQYDMCKDCLSDWFKKIKIGLKEAEVHHYV